MFAMRRMHHLMSKVFNTILLMISSGGLLCRSGWKALTVGLFGVSHRIEILDLTSTGVHGDKTYVSIVLCTHVLTGM